VLIGFCSVTGWWEKTVLIRVKVNEQAFSFHRER
jgi:hypothetical protein